MYYYVLYNITDRPHSGGGGQLGSSDCGGAFIKYLNSRKISQPSHRATFSEHPVYAMKYSQSFLENVRRCKMLCNMYKIITRYRRLDKDVERCRK